MAVVINQNDPNKKKDTEEQTGLTIPSGSSVGGAPAPQTQAGTAPPPQQGSGRFVNLQRYINANQGAGERIAGKIGTGIQGQQEKLNKTLAGTSTIQNQIQGEKDRIAQASGYGTQIQADPTKLVPMTMDQYKTSSTFNPYQNVNPAATPAPGTIGLDTKVDKTPEQVNAEYQAYLDSPEASKTLNAVTQLRTGQTNAGNIQNATQQQLGLATQRLRDLQGTANMTGSESGRFQLLQDTLGRRQGYSTGQQGLDQLLLQSQGNALANLRNTANTGVKTGQRAITTTGQNLETGRKDVLSQAQEAQKSITGALGRMDDPTTTDVDESAGALGSLQSDLKRRVGDYQKGQGEYLTDIQKQLQTGEFDPSMLDQISGNTVTGPLGLGSGQHLYGVDLSKYVKPSYSADTATVQNIANQGDYARYQALSKLSGGSGDYLKQDQLGTAGKVDLGANKTALQSALQSAQDRYNQLSTDKSVFGNDHPTTAAELQNFKDQYSGADYLNRQAQFYQDTAQNGGGTQARQDWMGMARQEQTRRLAHIEELMRMNPDQIVRRRGQAATTPTSSNMGTYTPPPTLEQVVPGITPGAVSLPLTDILANLRR